MTAPRPIPPSLARWLAPATLVLLVVAAAFTGLGNQWVQDDLPIISVNDRVHSFAAPWRHFAEAYWPSPYPSELYRPLTIILFAAEWSVGGGNPVLFRVVSILLYALATLAVFALGRRLLPPGAAWLAAALFAVHPVHVEAVAVAVNQAELLVGGLMALLTALYIDRRRRGPLAPGWSLGFAAAFLAGGLVKEHALMLPGLLAAAELTVIADPRPWRERLRGLRLHYLLLVLMAVVVVLARDAVLIGNTKGTFTAEALIGLSLPQRALTMLGVVPEWVRLLVWPAHLQADYSPSEIVGATGWGMAQTLGALLLVVLAAQAWLQRRRRPTVAFGIMWIAIGLFPVSNVLVPTGIVLAERTLFLASIGAVLAGTDALWAVGQRLYTRSSLLRIALGTAIGGVLLMGATRSASRQQVWSDLPTLWHQTLIDAPLSYRAHHAYAQILFAAKAQRSAEFHYRRSMELFPAAWVVTRDLADKYRESGQCEPAVRLYRQLLRLSPENVAGRGALIACLFHLGEYAAAGREARIGVEFGYQPKTFALYATVADSALRIGAPAGTISAPPPVDSFVPRPPTP